MEIRVRQLAERLAGLQPARLAALELVNRLDSARDSGTLDARMLMSMGPQIEAALQETEQLSETGKGILRRCLNLTPIPHPKVPLGF